MRAKYRIRREEAYAEGLAEYDKLATDPTFRDFVVLYIAEGYKRSRNTAAICNSDPAIMSMSARWMKELSGKELVVRVQYHADQDPDALREFWAKTLRTDPQHVRLQAKSNSGQLRARVWRCEHGVAQVVVYDTLFRARLAAWIDRARDAWR